MSFLDTLRQWDEGANYADREDLIGALRIFLSIQEPNSKIYFNIGCLHLLNQDLDAAEKAFDSSIRKDEHLAVAFFQRAITFYKMTRFEESLADFLRAFKELRGNQLIDYKALGLRYKLNACEVLHNMALSEAQLGNWERAQESLVKALDYKAENKLNIIDSALQSTLKQKLFKLVEFPSKVLFKPNKHYVAELEKKDYLGKAKIIASVVPQDEFSGFAPLQPQVESGPTCPKEPEVLRALEGEPHTVLYEFVPETGDELAVVPGNIVFVLQKGADNWASVIFNGRWGNLNVTAAHWIQSNVSRNKGLVPYNYLERLEISLASKQNDRIPKPPSQRPPSRPERKQGPTSSGDSSGDVKLTDDSCIVKVRFKFTFVVLVQKGSPYAVLIDKVSKKLNVPADDVTLSLTSEAMDQCIINGNTDMKSFWSSVKGRSITLWCRHIEQTDGMQHDEIHLLALHTYESSNPEDLTFHQGDTITLLSRVNQDWLEGQCHGNTGIFPASFVEEVPINGK